MTVETTPATTPDTGFADPPATVTAAQQMAKDFIDGFRELSKKLPKFESPHPTTVVSQRGRLNMPPAFAKAVADQVAMSPELQVFTAYDLEGTQSDIQQVDALTPVADEMRNYMKAMLFSLNGKRVKVNNAGLRMYAFARAMARDPQYAHIGAVADTINEARRRKKRPATAGAPPSQNGGVVEQKGGATTTAATSH